MPSDPAATGIRLRPERAAYWYFRLNGFLQIENFIVHPYRRGGERTDADLLGVRFRHRAEFAFHYDEEMADDESLLISDGYDDVVIVEVKSNAACSLNGPWTKRQDKNMWHVLAAIGCFRRNEVPSIAELLYDKGSAYSNQTRIRLVCVGRERSREMEDERSGVIQLTWDHVFGFIWARFDRYRLQKAQTQQWDVSGRHLKSLAETHSRDRAEFVESAKRACGIGSGSPYQVPLTTG